MPTKDGWTHDSDHDKLTLGAKTYRNMQTWSRPCGVCGERFAIHVRSNGDVVNSAFGLKTCKAHRGQKINGAAINHERVAELEKELADAYETNLENLARIKSLFEELQVCKAKLAGYELSGAMALVAENSLDTKSSANGKINGESLTMPWQTA